MERYSANEAANLIGDAAVQMLHSKGLLVVSEEEWSTLQQEMNTSELEIRRLKKELLRYARKIATWKTFGKSCS
ncbi:MULTISPECIES: hypothetical protein [Fictibacillus]|uniref:Uncharacterized protein n=1 Tax=Fictibacillus terranigra TaxID=3058424 RepID=A0ABT8E2T9_9BACL|nr:hypothetical protein [Fictibacillus sp. CENA-BCM004]MDN4072234.1 hypothetical protein [Fictibacillus sp. CENA-BCM004]